MKRSQYMAYGLCVLLMMLTASQAVAQDKEQPKYDAYDEFARANKYVSYGSYKRAIPHYEHVLEVEPQTYNIVHYNLGEIYRAQKNCTKAVFHYSAYIGTGSDPDALELSKKSIKECDISTWPALTVTSSSPGSIVRLNGFVFTQEGKLDGVKVGPGTYEITVEAPGYITQIRDVTLESGKSKSEEFKLEQQTFFGTTIINVDQPGATLKLIPKKLDKPELAQGEVQASSPMKEPLKLATGKYMLEVTRDGYDRWIRHIYISRDQKSEVTVTLTKELPIELRLQP